MARILTQPYNNVILVCFSGIPGAGKTTALKELQQSNILPQLLAERGYSHIIFKYVLERSDEWKAKGYLAEFYKNTSKRALSFQLHVFHSHVESVQQALNDVATSNKDTITICIVERSIWDQLLFWTHQDRSKDVMDNECYMNDWNMKSQLIPPISLIFFCKTKNIQTTMKRVKKREEQKSDDRTLITSSVASTHSDDSEEEEIVTDAAGLKLDYQTKLYEKHCEWFTSPLSKHGIPCVHLDTDMPYHNDRDALIELANVMTNHLIPLIASVEQKQLNDMLFNFNKV